MQILVTGGAGFIGGHIAQRLVRGGHDVTVLDSLHEYYDPGIKRHTVRECREDAEDGGGSYRFVEGDLRDESLVADLVEETQFVYHEAGRAGVRDSVAEPRVYDDVNVDGTLNVLDAARRSSVERVVMASSSSVYGTPEYLPCDESHPTAPVSPYGASKLAAERYGCAYSQVYDLPFVALRYFTVYGPRMRPNMAISNFVSRCANGEPPVLYGDGSQTRDFTYIDDVVSANLALLDEAGADGEAINIGSTDTITIRGLAEVVCEETGTDPEFEFAERHAADAKHTHADTTAATELIGYEPATSIREGVSEFVDWYRENRGWYEPLVRSS
jgi:UDP-glucose 4-epimerase